jgi:hypothetical protein
MFRAVPMLAAALALTLSSASARADIAAAEALFQQGRDLLDQGKVDAACEKFESSQASEASSGTLLNLADCRLRQGRTATAWAQFVAAERLAQVQSRPEHATEAARRRTELEPTLSTLTLRVTDAPDGLEVRVNGHVVSAGSYGTRVPMDPGRVTIEARAPQREPAKLEVTINPDSHHAVVDLPRLAARGVTLLPPSAGERKRTETQTSGVEPLPWVIGGVGVAALTVGGVFGVMALSSNSDAERLCNGGTRDCPESSLAKESDRDREAMLSTIFVSVGVLGVGVASVMLLTSSAPETSDSADWLSVDLGLTAASGYVSAAARF